MTLVAPTVWACLHILWHVAHVWPILMKLANVLDHTLICLWWHRGLSDTQTTVLSGQRKARPALLLFSPWGFLTQNKQKVCFLGLLKSCRHLVLYRGQIIYHSTLSLILVSPSSVASHCKTSKIFVFSFVCCFASCSWSFSLNPLAGVTSLSWLWWKNVLVQSLYDTETE